MSGWEFADIEWHFHAHIGIRAAILLYPKDSIHIGNDGASEKERPEQDRAERRGECLRPYETSVLLILPSFFFGFMKD